MRYFSEDTVKRIIMDMSYASKKDAKHILNSYPSIEIKGRHGRLGDLDAMKEDFNASVDEEVNSGRWSPLAIKILESDRTLFNGTIDRTPTVIPANR